MSAEEIWREKISRQSLEFYFITQDEGEVCHVQISGYMNALHDMSRVSEFEPDPAMRYCVMNLDTLELMDTYGSQVFLELVERIRKRGGVCITAGASPMIRELLSLLSIDELIEHCATEIEALKRIEQLRGGAA
jgi:anti-anti-sigma factor